MLYITQCLFIHRQSNDQNELKKSFAKQPIEKRTKNFTETEKNTLSLFATLFLPWPLMWVFFRRRRYRCV